MTRFTKTLGALRFGVISYVIATATFAAHADDKRWVELKYSDYSITYDLNTVSMITPSKFTIMYTRIDNPDVMKFNLTVLDTLRTFCAYDVGQYDAPAAVFTLGKPDMPIAKIEVSDPKHNPNFVSYVMWREPYSIVSAGAQENIGFFMCKGKTKDSNEKDYREMRDTIIGGTQDKVLYDCSHAIMGLFPDVTANPSSVVLGTNITGAFLTAYMKLCPAVTGQPPYLNSP